MGQVFAEAYRLRLMRGLEDFLGDSGIHQIAGVDEAGRGCLAGPVVAGAVLVEPGKLVPGVDDSKSLSAERRERLASAIRSAHPVSAVVAVSPDIIDRINILQATRLAMARAVAALSQKPELVLVDAVRIDTEVPSLSVIRGDQISYAVACASILAKVERDRLMTELGRSFPQYDFAANKGYGSAAHRQALVDHGPCEAHRLTFRSVLPRLGASKASPKTSERPKGSKVFRRRKTASGGTEEARSAQQLLVPTSTGGI